MASDLPSASRAAAGHALRQLPLTSLRFEASEEEEEDSAFGDEKGFWRRDEGEREECGSSAAVGGVRMRGTGAAAAAVPPRAGFQM